MRRVLTLAAHNAARSDAQCRAVCETQRGRGKHHTVALSHVARQLLHIAYGVLLHERPYALPERFTATPEVASVGA